MANCSRRRIREQIHGGPPRIFHKLPGKSASVHRATISSQVRIKKNAENASIPGFQEWNVNCTSYPVSVRA